MTGRDVIKALDEQRSKNYCFVKCWRKEADLLDYDLVDRFLENTSVTEEFGGIDLLTMDDMWNEVLRVSGTRVTLVHDESGDKVEWLHKGKTGLKKNVCAFTPETLMEIFDVETKGNPVDS